MGSAIHRAGAARAALSALAGCLLSGALIGFAAPPAGASALTSGVWSFPSQPALSPPGIETSVPASRPSAGATGGAPSGAAAQAPGYIFLSPIKNYSLSGAFLGKPGPEIVEANGNPVWEHPLGERIKVGSTEHYVVAMDFQEQTYEHQPVLVWWQGYITPQGFGNGAWQIVNDHYQTIATVHAPRGFELDFHEIAITPRGDAYILANRLVQINLQCCGGPANGSLYDQELFEVEIKTGRIIWRWDPLQHVHLRDSYAPPTGRVTWDPYHVNSLAFGPGGAPIVSMRNTWAAYWIDRRSGGVFATLGGKHSTFALGPGVRFAWQHDVRQRADEHVSVFDDEAAPAEGKQSRGELIALDWRHHTTSLTRQYLLPRAALAGSQGNVEEVAGGNVFIGWGQLPYFSEYTSSGSLLYLGRLPGPDESYRAFRYPWTGIPAEKPGIAAAARGGGGLVYASWNGATQVASWRLLAGASRSNLAPTGPPVARQGFETSIETAASGPYYEVQALDASGHVLGTSAIASTAPAPHPSSGSKTSRK
jgi:hypothetical protein